MAPADLHGLSPLSYALLFGALGFGFGFALELTGFGNTRKLAAQFYLRDLTVLKAMFTAIAVAAVLVFTANAFGCLDMSRVWVNPTFLWPGIAGGLVMGVGFVVGGFCPGTSLVAAATGKLDGMLFVLGALVGVGLFGESVGTMEDFFLSGSMGRYTLPEWLGLPTGTVVILVVAVALLMFVGAEALERRGSGEGVDALLAVRSPRFRKVGAPLLLALAAAAALRGEPNSKVRLTRFPELQKLVAERGLFVHPAEVVALRKDLNVRVDVLDLRSESDFNLFHLAGARRVEPDSLTDHAQLRALSEAAASSVTFLVDDDESRALRAWQELRTRGVTNLYVVEGGMSNWLNFYPLPACVATRRHGVTGALRWDFHYTSGASLPAASPELGVHRGFKSPCPGANGVAGPPENERDDQHFPDFPFPRRVTLQTKSLVKGGCG